MDRKPSVRSKNMNNGKSNSDSIWKTVFSSDKVIAALVVLLGGGNLVATRDSDIERGREVDRAITEIHQLFEELKPAIDRQKEILDILQKK